MPCDKNCASCGGCGGCSGCGALELSMMELEMLEQLGQYAFLPIARRADDATPCYPEGEAHTVSEYSLVLQLLEKKGLISLDFDKPLKNFSSANCNSKLQ